MIHCKSGKLRKICSQVNKQSVNKQVSKQNGNSKSCISREEEEVEAEEKKEEKEEKKLRKRKKTRTNKHTHKIHHYTSSIFHSTLIHTKNYSFLDKHDILS